MGALGGHPKNKVTKFIFQPERSNCTLFHPTSLFVDDPAEVPRREESPCVAGAEDDAVGRLEEGEPVGHGRGLGCNSIDILGKPPTPTLIMFGVLRHVSTCSAPVLKLPLNLSLNHTLNRTLNPKS